METKEFNNLVAKNQEYLTPFALHLTRNNEEAKDLLQETFTKAFFNKEKYKAGTNLKAWLYTIMRNIFINDYRRKSLRKTIVDNTEGQFLINNATKVTHSSGESTMFLKEMEEAIAALPDTFKTPFVLYVEGFKYGDIAAQLGEKLGTIKSRIHFARRLLKEQIERY
jgi:RNA polymerase sigma factor (sigma-70 family)